MNQATFGVVPMVAANFRTDCWPAFLEEMHSSPELLCTLLSKGGKRGRKINFLKALFGCQCSGFSLITSAH